LRDATASVYAEIAHRGMERGVGVAAGPFPQAAIRTLRALQSAPGFAQARQKRP